MWTLRQGREAAVFRGFPRDQKPRERFLVLRTTAFSE
jgi:hypothetical protein